MRPLRPTARLPVAGLALLVGCTSQSKTPALACSGRVDDDVATVILVTCTAREDVTARVRFGADGAYDHETPAQALLTGDVATFPLYGMRADTRVTWSAVTEDAAGNEASGEAETSTGPLPAGLPELTPLLDDTAVDPPPYLLGNVFGGDPVTFIVDRDGEYLWYHAADPSLWVVEVRFALTGDQPALLVEEFANDHTVDGGQIRRLTLTGDDEHEYDPVGAHHVFTELGPDAPAGTGGTIAYLSIDARIWNDPETGEDVNVVGDRIVEIAPDGTPRTVFSTWDWLSVTKPPEWDIPFYPQGKDWTHSNALHYYADTDTYLLSICNLQTLVELRRTDGVPVHWYGPGYSAPDGYGLAEGSLEFFHQHDAQRRPDHTLTMFTTDRDTSASGAVEYAVDDDAMTLTETWRGGFGVGLRSTFLGQVEPLPNGDVLVNYGSAREVLEVTRSDEPRWGLGLPVGNFFGQVHPFSDFYAGI